MSAPIPAEAKSKLQKLLLNEVQTIMTMRSRMYSSMVDPKRNIDAECGYPTELSLKDYKDFYDREGIATRVVSIFPEESWSMDPSVYEKEGSTATPWDKAWKKHLRRLNVWHYMHRVDEISGIGEMGGLFMGYNDGAPLDKAVAGINEKGEATGKGKCDVMYLRPFDQTALQIQALQADRSNPRYGQPLYYNVNFMDSTGENEIPDLQGQFGKTTISRVKVHWSRILHVADNRKGSEVFGIPRQQIVFNRLHDMRKLLAGCAEMFWKGAFPGYAFEVDPETAPDADLDRESLKEEFSDYIEGLQRFLAIVGGKVKSLAPQVANPAAHVEAMYQAIAVSLGIPLRVFLGAEVGQLASSQDMRTWNKRLHRRREKYLNPMMIRPYIDRCMMVGALPTVDDYEVEWPDLNAPTDQDKADIADKITNCLAKYSSSGIETFWPLFEFCTEVLGMTTERASIIQAAAEKQGGKRKFTVEPVAKTAFGGTSGGLKSAQGANRGGGTTPRPQGKTN